MEIKLACPRLFYVIFSGNILLAVVIAIALIKHLCGVQTISQQHLFKMKNVFKKTSCHFSFSFKKLSQYDNSLFCVWIYNLVFFLQFLCRPSSLKRRLPVADLVKSRENQKFS